MADAIQTPAIEEQAAVPPPDTVDTNVETAGNPEIQPGPQEDVSPLPETMPPEARRMNVGGRIMVFPKEFSNEQIEATIADYMASDAFDRSIDKDTGAPARVRMIVGSAIKPEDKLNALRNFYPEARPYGDDNFMYIDRETGKYRLVNPPGLDWGDVPGVAREATVGLFSGLGATAGGLVGGTGGTFAGGPPGTVAGGAAGAIYGAGAGAAVGSSLFDIAYNMIDGAEDTRTPVARVTDTAIEFFAGSAGQRAGELLNAGIKKARPGAQKLIDSFRQLRIDPPAGAVSGRADIATLEKTLEASPFSADIMQDQAETILTQTKEAASRVVAEIGVPQTDQGAGSVIKQAAIDSAERFGFTQARAYDEAFDLIGKETPVDVNSVMELRDRLETELSRAPRSLKKILKPAITRLLLIEKDAAEGGISFEALRQVRTMIGKELDAPVLSGSASAQNAVLRRIYGALTEDMSAAAAQAGPDAAHKLKVADRFTRAWMNTAASTMNKIAKFDADEKAFKYAMSSTRDGGSGLSRLRRNFTPEEWDTIASTVLNRMGLATPGAQNAAGDAFSVNTFLTNWSKLAPEAKQALFGGKRYAEIAHDLDRLVDVMGSLKGVEKFANSSNTGRVVVTYMALQALGGALVGAAAGEGVGGGGTGGGIAGVAGAVLAPRVAAKLITNPKFVRWLIEPATDAKSYSAKIGRLTGIMEAAPEIREEVYQFLEVLSAEPPSGRE